MAEAIGERDAGAETAMRICSILASRGLTLNRVSAESERLYGRESPSCIPHTLYHSLQNSPSFGPSLAQTCALSRITGYRLEDWLAVFGIDFGRMGGLQASLPLRRTTLIDPVFAGAGVPTGRLEELGHDLPAKAVVPLGRLLRWAHPAPLSSADVPHEPHRLFARIGSEDCFAFPELLPGSIVRVNVRAGCGEPTDSGHRVKSQLLLVEHARGLWCGRFHVAANGIVYASASKLAYAQIAFQCPQEARILGAVDMEIRWLHRFEKPVVPGEFAIYRQPRPLEDASPSLGAMVARARGRAGLTLREASRLSRAVSQALIDPQYATAQSTLAEYEVQNTPPRQLRKIITLCLIYGMRLMDFVVASGTALEFLGQRPIPSEFMPRCQHVIMPAPHEHSSMHNGSSTTPSLALEFGEVPWFLGSSLLETSGISRPLLRDFFWLNGDQPFLPACSHGSVLALVNRRKKKPIRIGGLPSWQQPAFVLLLRSGEYLCACSSLDDKTVVLYPESQRTRGPERLRLGEDAEVVGRIVALARRIK